MRFADISFGLKLVIFGAFLIGMVLEKELFGFLFTYVSSAGVVVLGGLLLLIGSFLMGKKTNGGR